MNYDHGDMQQSTVGPVALTFALEKRSWRLVFDRNDRRRAGDAVPKRT